METTQLYDLAKYYDIAFDRDLTPETDFFVRCFNEYPPFKVKKIIEAGCGSGLYLVSFAKRGYHITGYDISANMVVCARERAQKAGLADKAEAVQGDMRTMKFNKKYDAAVTPFTSLSYLSSDEDILNHFVSMVSSLRKGAVYVTEFGYAYDNIEKERAPGQGWLEEWEMERDGIKTKTLWSPDSYDKDKKIRHVTVKMEVDDNGKKLSFVEEHNLRLWFYDDLQRLSRLAGFRLKAVYTDKFELLPNKRVTGEDQPLYTVFIKE